jgi:hypothetical protein
MQGRLFGRIVIVKAVFLRLVTLVRQPPRYDASWAEPFAFPFTSERTESSCEGDLGGAPGACGFQYVGLACLSRAQVVGEEFLCLLQAGLAAAWSSLSGSGETTVGGASGDPRVRIVGLS